MYKKGIDAEEDPDEKQKLEEARDERIGFLEEKIQKLCFWHDVKNGNIGTPKEGVEPRIFPKDSNVYHFHPIAFVEQKFQGFFLPINYPEGNGKRLEVVDITKLNNQLAGETVKSDAENEKTT